MKVFIASDHGGFELKNRILEEITDFDIEDLGPAEYNKEDDYPDYAFKLTEKMQKNPNSFGILICKSGNGMVIAANKADGVYAALCFSREHAKKAREDDNSNVVCLDSEYDGDDPVEIVKEFLNSNFSGMDTRHGRRFAKITEYEKNN